MALRPQAQGDRKCRRVTGAAGLRPGGQQDPHPACCRLNGRVTLEACLVASKDAVCLLCGQAQPEPVPRSTEHLGPQPPPSEDTPSPAAPPSPSPPASVQDLLLLQSRLRAGPPVPSAAPPSGATPVQASFRGCQPCRPALHKSHTCNSVWTPVKNPNVHHTAQQ